MKYLRFGGIMMIGIVALTTALLAGCQKAQEAAEKSARETKAEKTTANDVKDNNTKARSNETTSNSTETTGATETSTSTQPGSTQGKRVIIETAKGTMAIELYPQSAPKTVENFVKLVGKGFYNGLTFHRVEPGFVIQGGDPNGNGTGGPGYTIPDEVNSRQHIRGTVAMAKTSAPDSAGSQFYICLAPQPSLDEKYTVFGQVVEGIDTIDKIQKGDKMDKVYLK